MTIKERIKHLCKNRGISLHKLEQDLGFAKGYISKLDKSTPNTKKMQLIADYFNVSVDYLMTGKDNRFSVENAELMADIMLDNEILETIKKFQKLNNEKKKHIIELIMMFSESEE